MKELSISDRFFKSIDKMLGHSLPLNVVKLSIELELDRPPVINVSYYPSTIVDETLINEQFTISPIKNKAKNNDPTN